MPKISRPDSDWRVRVNQLERVSMANRKRNRNGWAAGLVIFAAVALLPAASAQDPTPRSNPDAIPSLGGRGSLQSRPSPAGSSLGSSPTRNQIDGQRERLFNELAEEFSQFDRLGHLVRRVSQLVKPSVIHIEAHKVQGQGASVESYD